MILGQSKIEESASPDAALFSEMADQAVLLPGARRDAGKRVEVQADDMPAAYQSFRALVSLAS